MGKEDTLRYPRQCHHVICCGARSAHARWLFNEFFVRCQEVVCIHGFDVDSMCILRGTEPPSTQLIGGCIVECFFGCMCVRW